MVVAAVSAPIPLLRCHAVEMNVVRPAEGIDDVTVVGTLLDRAFDHAHALVEIDAVPGPQVMTKQQSCSEA
jgi:hypothetical protein